MLKRIYIDNYKSLVNFELRLSEINLFLGAKPIIAKENEGLAFSEIIARGWLNG